MHAKKPQFATFLRNDNNNRDIAQKIAPPGTALRDRDLNSLHNRNETEAKQFQNSFEVALKLF